GLETATVTGRRIVTFPANERGGHPRPRRPFAPRSRGNGRHDNGRETGRHANGVPGQAAVVPELDGSFPLAIEGNDRAGEIPATPGTAGTPGTPGLPAGLVPGLSGEPAAHAPASTGDLAAYTPGPPGAPPGAS